MGKNFQVVKTYFESVMQKPLELCRPIPFTGMQVIEMIWSLNDVFKPMMGRIRTVRYDAKHGKAADKAIEQFARTPKPETWVHLPGEVWRVLLERHAQFMTVCVANEVNGNKTFTSLPEGLPESAQLGGIMLFWLHGMELPFPVEDRSSFELPSGTRPTSMTLH